MDSQKNLEMLLALIDYIIMPVILAVAGIVIFFLYQADLLGQFIEMVVALGIYAGGLGIAYWVRNRKKKSMIYDSGSQQVQININYFNYFLHDCLLFLTPALIIIFIYWIKGNVSWTDVAASAICFIGLYLSELIYKR